MIMDNSVYLYSIFIILLVTSPCRVPPRPGKKSAKALRLSFSPPSSIKIGGPIHTLSCLMSFPLPNRHHSSKFLPRVSLLKPRPHLRSPFDHRKLPHFLIKSNRLRPTPSQSSLPRPPSLSCSFSSQAVLLHILSALGSGAQQLS